MNRLIVVSLLAAWPALGCGSSGGSGASSPAEDVGEDVSTDCLCEPEEHCGPDGSCQPDVCVQGGVTCATTSQIQYCDDTGADFTVVDCDAGYQCEVGSCAAIICEPGVTDCEAGYKVTCNSLGTQWVPVPCPETDVCVGGECVFVQPNILLLVDTSYSMNRRIGSDETPASCTGEAGCPPWTFPELLEGPRCTRALTRTIGEIENRQEAPGIARSRQESPGILPGPGLPSRLPVFSLVFP